MQTRVIGVVAIVVTAGISAVVACGGSSSTPSTGCEPGTKESCTGPNLCSGKQVCKPDRTYDACVCPPIPDASVPDDGVPVPDADSDAPIVEAGPDAKPFDPKPLTWIKGVNVTLVSSVAIDGNHDIVVGGYAGNGMITKLDAKGALLWEKSYFGLSSPASVLAVTGDAAGNTYAFLESPANVDYGGGNIVKSGRVLLKLDVNGKYVWHYGPLSNLNVTKMVTRPNGNIVLAGELYGPNDFGNGTVSPNVAPDALVVELTAAKALVRVKQFGDDGYQSIQDVVLDAGGNAYVVGWFNGTLDFGKGVMAGPPSSGSFSAPHAVFVAKLDASLNGSAQKNGGGTTGGDYLHHVAIDPFGNIAVSGALQSSIKLGANPVSAFTNGDVYVAYLDGSLGEIWSGGYGGYAGQAIMGLAERPTGGLVAAGFTNGTLSFGLGGLPTGTPGYFIVQFDTAGNPVKNFGASVNGGNVNPQQLRYLGGTDYVFAGTCQGGTLSIPQGTYPCTTQAFVARLAP